MAALVEGEPPDIVLNDEAVSLEGVSRAYIEAEAEAKCEVRSAGNRPPESIPGPNRRPAVAEKRCACVAPSPWQGEG